MAGFKVVSSLFKAPFCALPPCPKLRTGQTPAAPVRGRTGQYHQPVSAKAQTRSPKSEGRKKAETRNPICPSVASAFFRVSALGLRIWAADGGWYCPVRPPPVGS